MLGLLSPSSFVVSDPRICEQLTVTNIASKIQKQTNKSKHQNIYNDKLKFILFTAEL